MQYSRAVFLCSAQVSNYLNACKNKAIQCSLIIVLTHMSTFLACPCIMSKIMLRLSLFRQGEMLDMHSLWPYQIPKSTAHLCTSQILHLLCSLKNFQIKLESTYIPHMHLASPSSSRLTVASFPANLDFSMLHADIEKSGVAGDEASHTVLLMVSTTTLNTGDVLLSSLVPSTQKSRRGMGLDKHV